MTCFNDTPKLDVDSPIPYELTTRAREELQELAILGLQLNCPHSWTTDLAIGLVCGDCGAEASTRRSSIPSYLSPKEGRGR